MSATACCSCRWDETAALSFGLQRASCSHPRYQRGKPNISQKNLFQCYFVGIQRGLTWARTRTSVLRGRHDHGVSCSIIVLFSFCLQKPGCEAPTQRLPVLVLIQSLVSVVNLAGCVGLCRAELRLKQRNLSCIWQDPLEEGGRPFGRTCLHRTTIKRGRTSRTVSCDRGEVKPSALCRKMLSILKNPSSMM